MVDLEDRLSEAIKKKKEAEEKVKERKGTPIRALEQAIKGIFGSLISSVSASIVGKNLLMEIIPNKEFRECFETAEPFVYQSKEPLKKDEIEDLTKERTYAIKNWTMFISNLFIRSHFKPQLATVYGIEAAAKKEVPRRRIIEMFAYMCQKGSVAHCTELYLYVNHLIGQTLSEYDKSIVSYLTPLIKAAGFPWLAEFIQKLNLSDFTFEELDDIKDVLARAVKDIIEKQCNCRVSPSREFSKDEMIKSKKIVLESCKEDYLRAEPFDETLIIEALSKMGKWIPKLREYLGKSESEESVERPSSATSPAPTMASTPTIPTTASQPSALEESRRKLRNKMKKYE